MVPSQIGQEGMPLQGSLNIQAIVTARNSIHAALLLYNCYAVVVLCNIVFHELVSLKTRMYA
jgi:hypothetical protein